MSVAELKAKIIAKVSETNDEEVLENYLLAMNSEYESRLEFTENDLREFKEIEKEAEAGNYYTTEQVIANARVAIEEAMKKMRNEQTR